MTQFETFGLPAALNDALVRMNYKTATPIQAQAIPAALQGRDILGSAQTGTGKTAAFCIPLINHLMNDPTATALVMTPTRELAAQVNTVAQQLAGREHNIRTALLIGGDSMVKQFKQLNNRPRLIIGTPGRINDHLRRNRNMLESTSFVVLDEADRMLDMGFTIQIDEVFKNVPKQRQMLMFSATMPQKIAEFSKRYMNNPVRVAVASQQASADNISHEIVQTTVDQKYNELVKEIVARDGSIIVFVKTKRGADKMATRLQKDSYDAEAIHGDLKQSRRNRVIQDFREKKHRILIATDVASRGLDVPHVEHVINYDLPQVAEDYIHRIGRTARAGAKGNALCLLLPSDRSMWSEISRLMNPGQPGERHEEREARSGQKKSYRGGEWRKQRNRRGPDSEGFRKEGGFRKNNEGRKQGGYNADKRPRRDHNEGFKKEGFRAEKRQESGQQDTQPQEFRQKPEHGGQNEYRGHKHGPKKPFRKDGFKQRRDNEGFKPARRQEAGQEQGQENRREKNYNNRDGNSPNKSEGFKKEGRRPYQGHKKEHGPHGGGNNRPQHQKRDDQGFRPARRQDEGQQQGNKHQPRGEYRPENRSENRGENRRPEGGFNRHQARDDNGMRPPRRQNGNQQNRHDNRSDRRFEKSHDGQNAQPGGFKKGPGKPFRHRRDKRRPHQKAA